MLRPISCNVAETIAAPALSEIPYLSRVLATTGNCLEPLLFSQQTEGSSNVEIDCKITGIGDFDILLLLGPASE
ncbi:hypothetical protein NQ314_000222 [Rhamnusium bicolor]|uniref:Uncharacterized protein n=1 Tax=Rhamnusium bicolor TaxID=1586634 RepID=A0AAV8ZVB8_9CUCU|nr:hypothetical protein NQ314_000222 [Rhamnusium bicolor]